MIDLPSLALTFETNLIGPRGVLAEELRDTSSHDHSLGAAIVWVVI